MGPSLLFPGLPLNENTRKTIAQKIRAMFVGGVEGAWYDPSDLSTMFQDSSGMEPVTATGQTVWLMLDKSRGLVRGTENITTQDLAASPWASGGAFNNFNGATAVGATLTTLAASGSRHFRIACTPGQWFEATAITEGVSGTLPQIAIAFGTSGAAFIEINYSGAGSAAAGVVNQVIAKAPATAAFVEICLIVNGPGAGDEGIFESVSLRELPGNHAIQATSASRPIFRDVGGLRYLEFDGVDDYLRATFTIAQPIDRISAIRQVTWTNGDEIFSGGTQDQITLYQDGTTPNIKMWGGSASSDFAPAVGTNFVMTERYAGASSRGAVNSAAYTEGSWGTSDAAGGITLGASYLGTVPTSMYLHQLIERGGPTAMTDAQIAACRALSAVKSGVTL